MGNLQAYGEFGFDDAEQAEADVSGKGKFYKLKEGSTQARIVAPRVGEKALTTCFQHFVKISRDGKTFTVCIPCARMLANKPCLVCMKQAQLARTGNPLDEKLADDLQAKPAAYLNMVVRGYRPPHAREHTMVQLDKQVVVTFSPSPTLVTALATLRKDAGDFTHPTNGFDLMFIRKGTGATDTRYSVSPVKEPTPLLHPDSVVANEWIQGQPSLADKRRVLSEEEQKVMLSGKKREERTAFPRENEFEGELLEPPASTGKPRTAQDDMGGDWG